MDKDFSVVSIPNNIRSGFNSYLQFNWIFDNNKHDMSYPAKTPTMAGVSFSINRSYFYELGTYDEGMDFLGAENLEMSFRVKLLIRNLKLK